MKVNRSLGLYFGAVVASGALLVSGIVAATADPPSGNKVACSGPGCTPISPNRVHLEVNGAAYIPNQGYGQLIGDVTKLSFNYLGSGAEGGSPRFSIAIDTLGGTDANSAGEQYAFVDIVSCNDSSILEGRVDVINDPTCTIYFGSEMFPNWAAFVAAHPTYTIGYNYSFVIADSGTPSYDIWNLQITTKSRGGKAS